MRAKTSAYCKYLHRHRPLWSATLNTSMVYCAVKPGTLTSTHGAVVMLTADGSHTQPEGAGTFSFSPRLVCFNPGVSAW